MFAVIFKAKMLKVDTQYTQMAADLREKADNYGCLDFISTTEGDQEIAISYWPDMESIAKWKQDSQHLNAQALGKEKWYQEYSVEVVEVLRQYQSSRKE